MRRAVDDVCGRRGTRGGRCVCRFSQSGILCPPAQRAPVGPPTNLRDDQHRRLIVKRNVEPQETDHVDPQSSVRHRRCRHRGGLGPRHHHDPGVRLGISRLHGYHSHWGLHRFNHWHWGYHRFYHWNYSWYRPYWSHYRYRPYAYGAVSSAPVSVQQQPAAAPANCLTKQYLPNGGVIFQDRCTQESAVAPSGGMQAPQGPAGPSGPTGPGGS